MTTRTCTATPKFYRHSSSGKMKEMRLWTSFDGLSNRLNLTLVDDEDKKLSISIEGEEAEKIAQFILDCRKK